MKFTHIILITVIATLALLSYNEKTTDKVNCSYLNPVIIDYLTLFAGGFLIWHTNKHPTKYSWMFYVIGTAMITIHLWQFYFKVG